MAKNRNPDRFTTLKNASLSIIVGLIWQCVLGDPEVTANIYCKSRKFPNIDTQNYSTELR